MSDDSNLEPTDPNTDWLTRIGKSSRVKGVLAIVAVVTFIVTGLSLLSPLFGPIYPWLGIFGKISICVFVTSEAILCLALFKRNRRLEKDVLSLQQSPTMAENYRVFAAKHKELEQQKLQYAELESRIAADAQSQLRLNGLTNRLKEFEWLMERAKSEQSAITHSVSVLDFEYTGECEGISGLCFRITLLNESLFDLVLSERIDGFLKYDRQKWTDTRITCKRDVFVPSSRETVVPFQYGLCKADLEHFKDTKDKSKDGKQFCSFETANLRLTLKGAKPEYGVEPRSLDLKDVRIYDATYCQEISRLISDQKEAPEAEA